MSPCLSLVRFVILNIAVTCFIILPWWPGSRKPTRLRWNGLVTPSCLVVELVPSTLERMSFCLPYASGASSPCGGLERQAW